MQALADLELAPSRTPKLEAGEKGRHEDPGLLEIIGMLQGVLVVVDDQLERVHAFADACRQDGRSEDENTILPNTKAAKSQRIGSGSRSVTQKGAESRLTGATSSERQVNGSTLNRAHLRIAALRLGLINILRCGPDEGCMEVAPLGRR